MKLFFFIKALFKGARKSIYSRISFGLTIIDLEIILKEFLGPSNLAKAQILHIHELMEVVMIDKNKIIIFVVFWMVAPDPKDFNNHQKLIVVGLLSSLSRYYLSRKVGH